MGRNKEKIKEKRRKRHKMKGELGRNRRGEEKIKLKEEKMTQDKRRIGE